jgi:putative phosphoesterase
VRIAVVSDIHGNLTAFEAVLADLGQTSPDLVLHGGDLVHGGSMPAEIVDRVSALGWEGVVGNTDEMLWMPESLDEFARNVPKLAPLMATIRQMIPPTLEKLGDERLAWLRNQPRMQRTESVALVHASPESCWRAPMPNATDEEMQSTYGCLERPIAVYGHIHRSHVRSLRGMTVVNTGSVSLSYDGDPRASYLLLDGSNATIRRVSYDIEAEARAIMQCGLPHAEWICQTLRAATYVPPAPRSC